jgi:hypothetical protein
MGIISQASIPDTVMKRDGTLMGRVNIWGFPRLETFL